VKRIAFVLLTACAIVFATSGVALANFGPHGSYASDTDACAECHRAHTAVSAVTWTDNQGAQKNALLISDSTSMTDFCYACHGDGVPGAATDVESGYFNGANSSITNSKPGAALNGGGFVRVGGLAGAGGTTVMSSHNVSGLTAQPLVRWGYVPGSGSGLAPMAAFTCSDCHDPHGSSNYRLLKDVVNGVTVGGYVGTNNTPDPWVISNEQGYPQGGFKKGAAGVADIANYRPNYTSPQYAHNAVTTKSTSAWCAACHTVYAQSDSNYNYGTTLGAASGSSVLYHRHPIDVSLSVGISPNAGDRSLITQLVDDPGLPLEMGYGQTNLAGFSYSNPNGKIWDYRGNVSCLTCHVAHGSAATMSGWAATALGVTGVPNTVSGTTNPLLDGTKFAHSTPATHVYASNGSTEASGTNPTFDSALLRYNNRGVCERCHNK
jgi:predicted CXXCH cytochrome family protein